MLGKFCLSVNFILTIRQKIVVYLSSWPIPIIFGLISLVLWWSWNLLFDFSKDLLNFTILCSYFLAADINIFSIWRLCTKPLHDVFRTHFPYILNNFLKSILLIFSLLHFLQLFNNFAHLYRFDLGSLCGLRGRNNLCASHFNQAILLFEKLYKSIKL